MTEQLMYITIQPVSHGTPLADSLLEFIENFSWLEVQEHTASLVRSWSFSDWERPFVALSGDRIVGMATLMKTDYYPLPEISPWVSTIFVDEEFRGRGICGMLIATAHSYAKSLGFARSYIPTAIPGLYEKYGYRYLCDIVNYVGDTDRLYVKELN